MSALSVDETTPLPSKVAHEEPSHHVVRFSRFGEARVVVEPVIQTVPYVEICLGAGLERTMLRFRRMKTLQKFASVHASLHNHFSQERHLVDRETYKQRRSAALAEWQTLVA